MEKLIKCTQNRNERNQILKDTPIFLLCDTP